MLEASPTLGPEHGTSLLEQRLAQLRQPDKMVIMSDLHVGMTGDVDLDLHMGKLYAFLLNQKLERIIKHSPWYADATSSPWSRAVITLEILA